MKIQHFLPLFFFVLFSLKMKSQCPQINHPFPGPDCENAMAVCGDLNGYCGTLSFDNYTQPFPGCPAYTLNNDDWLAFTAGSTEISILIMPSNCGQWVPNNPGMQAALYQGSCYGDVVAAQCLCTTAPFILSTVTIPGVTYYLVLDGCAGDVCDYEIQVLGGSTIPVSPSSPAVQGPDSACPGMTYFFEVPNFQYAIHEWSVSPPNAGVFTNEYFNYSYFTANQDFAGQAVICATVTTICGLTSSSGCLTLDIVPLDTTHLSPILCPGDCFEAGGQIFCDPGIFELLLYGADGCDSTVVLHISQGLPSLGQSTAIMPCEGFLVFNTDTLTENGLYQFTIPNGTDCDSLHTLYLLPGDVDATAGPDKNLNCNAPDSIQLAGGVGLPASGFSFTWDTADGLLLSGTNTLTPWAGLPGTYCLTVTNDNTGCKLTDCMKVGADFLLPTFGVTKSGIPCVAGQTVQLCYDGNNSQAASYFWTTADGNIVGAVDQGCATVDLQGTYCLTVTSQNGCTKQTCTALFNDLAVDITAPASSCPGPVSFGLTATSSYQSGGTLFYSVGQNPSVAVTFLQMPFTVTRHFVLSQSEVEITAWAVDNSGCTSDTVSFFMENDAPDYDLEVVEETCGEATINLLASQTISYIAWSNGGTGTSTTVSQDGFYSFVAVFTNSCTVRDTIFVELDYEATCAEITGTVRQDDFDNCVVDAGEMPLAGWTVYAYGQNGDYYATTQADGNYYLPVEPGDYSVVVLPPSVLWEPCQSAQSVSVPNVGTVANVDFQIELLAECPLMTVDIGSALLRLCQNNYFSVRYCNLGTATATGSFVDITLGTYMSMVSASLPFTDLGNDVVRFQLGDVAPGACEQFSFKTFISCAAPLGFVHCTEAHIYPDTSCFPPNPMWSGAILQLTADCANGTQFEIRNVGTGAMSQPLTYTVYRNSQLFLSEQVPPLGPDDFHPVILPADSASWRIEVQQDAFYPYASTLVGILHGCSPGGLTEGGINYVNAMTVNDHDSFVDVDCRPNIGSFDPNVKEASPTGYGAEHFIADGTSIEYLVRFQNTGTGPATSVVVRDQLSDYLDVGTLVMGASSHHYDYQLVGNGLLKINFPGIELPPVTEDEDRSIGFVSFKIALKEGLVPNTRIENSAAIYFDQNEPVWTNTVFHTIEKPVVHAYQSFWLCRGEEWNGTQILADTMWVETLQFAFYDSLTWTQISVQDGVPTQVQETICQGETVMIGDGNHFSESGFYEVILTTSEGCDSIVELSLEVLPVYDFSRSTSICYGDSALWQGQYLTESGTYSILFTATNGCDSTQTLELTVLDSIGTTVEASFCEGETYQFGQEILTAPGVYEGVFESVVGCDSTVVLILSEEPVFQTDTTIFVVFGTIINNIPIVEETLFSYSLTALNGCDSTVNLTYIPVVATREGIENLHSLTVFPNPAGGHFFIQFDLGETTELQIELLDVTGRNVLAPSGNRQFAAGSHSVEIGAGDWPSGVYLVRLKGREGTAVVRVVVQ